MHREHVDNSGTTLMSPDHSQLCRFELSLIAGCFSVAMKPWHCGKKLMGTLNIKRTAVRRHCRLASKHQTLVVIQSTQSMYIRQHLCETQHRCQAPKLWPYMPNTEPRTTLQNKNNKSPSICMVGSLCPTLVKHHERPTQSAAWHLRCANIRQQR